MRAELERREEAGERHLLHLKATSGTRDLRRAVVDRSRVLGAPRPVVELMRRLLHVDERGTSRKTRRLEAAETGSRAGAPAPKPTMDHVREAAARQQGGGA